MHKEDFVLLLLFVRLSVCLSVYPCVCPFIRVSVCLSVCLSICLFAYLSNCPSISLPACLSVWFSACLSWVSVHVCLRLLTYFVCVFVSVCLFVYTFASV